MGSSQSLSHVKCDAAVPGYADVTRRKPANTAASVRQRLMNVARERREDFQYVLTRYGLERLLYRLANSSWKHSFVLKGAALFQLWTDQPHRPTRDIDLLGRGETDTERFEELLREICAQENDDDGLTFDPSSIAVEQIKEEEQYRGIRMRLSAYLGSARIPLQVDIGFGDAITPQPSEIEYPGLLDLPPARILAYPKETVVAEKFQAMVMLGIANSRMKDFYDIWTLASQFAFDGSALSEAVQATFQRRETLVPSENPLAFTTEFTSDERKQQQWRAFLRKGRLADPTLSLPDVTDTLVLFLMPPAIAASQGIEFRKRWSPSGPWQ